MARRRQAARIAAALALATASLAFVVADAEAASRACRQIEAQLAGGSGGSGSVKKYEKAIAAQQQQIAKARAQAREASCGMSFLNLGRERCGPINATIKRMEANLSALQKKKGELSGGMLSRSERARLVAALDANGCRDDGQRVASNDRPRGDLTGGRTRDGGSLFNQLFGGGVKPRDEFMAESRVRVALRPGGGFEGGGGQYRTMCVRTCDGYYFPMSGASSAANFERDQKNCESMCPGTEVKLFYHRAATEESEAMVSVSDGQPYTTLPTAFQYRDPRVTRNAQCGCNPQRNFSVIAGELPPPMSQPVQPLIPQPVERPDPAADPETLANADGGLSLAAIRTLLKPREADTTKTASNEPARPTRIRVVGPVFLPDPEGAIDLRFPGQPKVQ
ncbi:MAG: DUF2865 domain-containing protein [Rhizobiaceae bacterium]